MKKISLGALCLLAFFCMISVFLIGGQLAAYIWNVAVFIFSPIAIIALLIQLIVLMVFLIKKKNVSWNIRFIAVTFVMALPITVLLGISPVTYPTNANSHDTIIATIPVEDAVIFGGKEYRSHAMWPSECYAYDIVKEPHDVGSKNLEDYGIYNCDVYSPVSGTVIATENNEPDITPNTDEFTSSMGNYIYIKIDGHDSYLILAHFKQDSISVGVGDHVEQKQLVGKVGNSGTTSEPHLHVQHQRNNPLDMTFPSCAEGLPIIFSDRK
ncbi:MAG: peptidoglycan DD-metalloendopeptidase family protein [Faecalibacterium sp.]|jgi:hypothetical protein|nr:peptidoglycan DD-metalloendopeptidase family protein [Faecalibacterium sp.]